MSDWIGLDWMDGYPILLWHQEHRSRAMLKMFQTYLSLSDTCLRLLHRCHTQRWSQHDWRMLITADQERQDPHLPSLANLPPQTCRFFRRSQIAEPAEYTWPALSTTCCPPLPPPVLMTNYIFWSCFFCKFSRLSVGISQPPSCNSTWCQNWENKRWGKA